MSRSFAKNRGPVTFGRTLSDKNGLTIRIPFDALCCGVVCDVVRCVFEVVGVVVDRADHYYLSVTVTKAKRGERPS